MAENTEHKTADPHDEDTSETKEDKKRPEAEDLLHKAYLFGLGLRKDLEESVNKLIERGEEETEEKEKAIDDVLKKAREKASPLEHKIEELVNKVLDSMNLVSKEKFEALEKRVVELEQQLKKSEQE
jgi:polyhydroxyalkanoate synthesis regulator phasin